MIADLDTLLIALYVELTDRIIPARGFARSGPGRPPEVTDAELACLAVAQVLLRCDDERHWLRAAPRLVGHLLPATAGPEPVQHPAAADRAADGGRPALARRRHPGHRGATAADGRHPGPVRHLRRHRETLRPVRARRLRVLPEPFALVLGRQAADHLHMRRARHRVQPREPEAARRAGPAPANPGTQAREPPRA